MLSLSSPVLDQADRLYGAKEGITARQSALRGLTFKTKARYTVSALLQLA